MSIEQGLLKKQTVVELVATYEQAVVDIRRGFAIVAAAQDSLQAAFGESYKLQVRDKFSRTSINFEKPDDSIAELKREIWRLLVERLEIRRMMSMERTAKLDRQLEREELPEITVDNVVAFCRGIEEQLPSMIQEAVTEVFDWLRPRGSQYKTNTEFEIGKKVILTYVIEEPWALSSHFRVNHHYRKNLVALENVFSALDGRGTIAKGSWDSEIAGAIDQTPLHSGGRGETRYFRFRCFKNRNLHLEFKRPDLVEKLNQIAGGLNLREKRDAA